MEIGLQRDTREENTETTSDGNTICLLYPNIFPASNFIVI